MKFTILPDFEYKRKKRELRKKKRAERRAAQQNRINYRYLKRKKFWMVWLERFIVVFLIIGMGGIGYFYYILNQSKNHAEQEMSDVQESIERYTTSRYEQMTEMGIKAGKAFDEQLGAFLYRVIPIREYYGLFDGVSAAASVIYSDEGEMIIDSSPKYYLVGDRYEQIGEKEEQVTLILNDSYYVCAQELPDEFLQDYMTYSVYSDYENGDRMEFGNFYLDNDSRQFYFSTVTCYEHWNVVKTYDFTPEHVEGMETVRGNYKDLVREGTHYYPVLGSRTPEIPKLLEEANGVYNKFKKDSRLSGAWVTTERGLFSFTKAMYSVVEMQDSNNDNTRYTIVTAYKYDFFQKYRSFTLKLVSGLLLAILVISFLWAKFTYVRLKARYELEDYQRSLTNAMAHDLKSPLMILSGMAENLKENVHTEKREYYADEMLKNISDMNHMIEQSLGFSKLGQTGKIDRKTDVDMRAQTENLVRKYKELSEAHEQHISVTGEGTMRGNEAMLRQLADNLLQNAILHGEEGGQIEITVGKGTYQIQNTYTGLLTTEDAKKLLKPYTKEENRKRTGGHGLGLSIVNEIVKLHGGKIHLKVTDNTFEVSVKI